MTTKRMLVAGATALVAMAACPVTFADETSVVAAATPHASEPAPTTPVSHAWYGWQTLLVDATSLLELPVLARATRNDAAAAVLGGVAAGSYVLGPALVHVAHGDRRDAVSSIVLRLLLPALGALAGGVIGLTATRDEGGLETGTAIGGGAGVIGAIAIDFFGSREHRGVDVDVDGPPRAAATTSIRVSPTVAPRKEGGVDLGFAATF